MILQTSFIIINFELGISIYVEGVLTGRPTYVAVLKFLTYIIYYAQYYAQ